MKFTFTTTFMLLFSLLLSAQDSCFEGKVSIGECTPSAFTSNFDIRIERSIANTDGLAGINIFNPDASGRSVIQTGEGLGGRYIYMSYLNSSYEPNPSTSTAFRANAGVIYTGGNNGLSLIAGTGNISFTAGGLTSAQNRMEIDTNGNVGIGTSEPVERLQITDGDVYIEDIGNGIIMKDSNGNCWRYTPDTNGQLIGTLLASCPN